MYQPGKFIKQGVFDEDDLAKGEFYKNAFTVSENPINSKNITKLKLNYFSKHMVLKFCWVVTLLM